MKEGASRNVLRGIIQYDTLNEVNIRLSDGTKAFNYDGYTNIIFKVLKPDGTAYVNSATDADSHVIATSPIDGIVTVMLSGQATTAAGMCQSVIEIYEGSEVLTTARFNYEVFEGLNLDDAVESTTELPILTNLIAEVSALEAAIEAAEAQRVAAEAIRADEASGYVAQTEQLVEQAQVIAYAAQASAIAAQEAAREAQSIAGNDYATNSGSQAYTNNQIAAHNTGDKAHADIRTLVGTAQATANSAVSAAATAKSTADGKANASHKHSAADITSGILPVERGGTGVSNLASLAVNLGALQMQTGSYVGTGTNGAGNPTSITFDFSPRLWGFYAAIPTDGGKYSYGVTMFPWGVEGTWSYLPPHTNNSSGSVILSYRGTTVELSTSNQGATGQANMSGYTYYYFAIG